MKNKNPLCLGFFICKKNGADALRISPRGGRGGFFPHLWVLGVTRIGPPNPQNP